MLGYIGLNESGRVLINRGWGSQNPIIIKGDYGSLGFGGGVGF